MKLCTEEGILRCGHVVEDAELTEIFSALDADGTGSSAVDSTGDDRIDARVFLTFRAACGPLLCLT